MSRDDLTMREQEITRLIVEGQSNREIAYSLSLAYETVKWYTKRIYSKLGVANRTQLILTYQQIAEPTQAPTNDAYALPQALTQLVGRDDEIATIGDLLARERLITLAGPGGIGKTRLSLAVGQRHLQQNPVLFMPLQSVETVEALVASLSRAFGISLSGFSDPREHLLDALPSSPSLLILDSAEHVRGIAPLAADLLEHAAGLRILVTSRRVLRLQTEKVVSVQGLSADGQDTHDSDAVRLFRERSHFEMSFDDVDDPSTLHTICTLLEGNPLAIELAASWSRVLTPAQILAELEQGIDLLQGRFVDVEDRHQSMVAVCEQSWAMLSRQEQRILMQLAVFQGGFTAQAAQSVAAASPILLAGLVDKSMLRCADSGRYQIHDVLRLFALEQAQSGDGQSVHHRHARYYIRWLADRENGLRQWNQRDTLQQIDLELDNIVTAWTWATRNQQWDGLDSAMQPLARFLSITDRSLLGASLFDDALQQITDGGELRAGLLLFKGWHEIWVGNTDAGAAFLLEGLDWLEDHNVIGQWAMPKAILSFHEGFDIALRHRLATCYQRDAQAYELDGNAWGAAWMRYSLGNLARADGNHDASVTHLQHSLEVFEAVGDLYGQAWALDALSTTYRRMEAYDLSTDAGQRLEAVCRAIPYVGGLVIAYEVYGDVARVSGDMPGAYQNYRTGLEYAAINADATNIIPMLQNLAGVISDHPVIPVCVAVEMLAIVATHPSSRSGWFAFRQTEAQAALEHLRQQDTDNCYYEALLRGQSAELVSATRRLLSSVLPESI
jgi:predicted ATPase/DNA-binding CsgD family transcriptional regulator